MMNTAILSPAGFAVYHKSAEKKALPVAHPFHLVAGTAVGTPYGFVCFTKAVGKGDVEHAAAPWHQRPKELI